MMALRTGPPPPGQALEEIMQVKQIMTKDPICCIPQDTALDAAWLLKKYGVGALPVVTGQTTRRLVGMVTDRDLCLDVLSRNSEPYHVTVARSMTRHPVACYPEDSLETCAEMMTKYHVRRVPVVNESGACVGIVTVTDLAKCMDSTLLQTTIQGISEPTLLTEALVA
jgi:CBS domain-containing protein